jgi:NAD(P)H-flavin reductase
MTNIYQPDLMEVLDVQQQTADVKSVRVRFRDETRGDDFHFRVGQFGMFSCSATANRRSTSAPVPTGKISSSSAFAAPAA